MPTGLVIGVFATSWWALWTRRSAIHCRWEGAPALIIVTGAAVSYLTSPSASRIVGPALYQLTGIWNLEDFLAHVGGIVAACAAVYMAIIRFGTLAIAQRIFAKWVAQPVVAALPLGFALFVWGQGGRYWHSDFYSTTPVTMAPYWLLLVAVWLYLWGIAARMLLTLRSRRPSVAVTMYLTATLAIIAAGVIMAIHTLTPLDIVNLAWAAGCAGAVIWMIAAGYSWMQRSRPLDFKDLKLAQGATYTPREWRE